MSSSEYHYVQSSSKLIDQEEDEDIEEEEEEEEDEKLHQQKFDNDDEAYERDYENNLELHKNRHRALSVSGGPADKRHKTIVKPHADYLNSRDKTRRTNSYNETNSVEIDQVNQKHRGHSNMGLDISDLKASFKRLLKPKIPNQHSISVNSVKSNKRPTKQEHMLIKFNRSQSHNPCANEEEEDDEEEDDDDDFDQQENQTHHFDSFLKNKVFNKGSKLNFLSKSFEDKTIHGHMRTTSAVSEEVSPFSSSSTSQSSTPSTSISKNHQADHYVAFQSGKEKLKIVVDENNNNTLNNSIRLDDLNKLRKNKQQQQHNDSIRMRHNSSKANAELKSPGSVNEAGHMNQAVSSNLVLIANSFDSHSSDDNQEGKVWKRAKSSGVNNYFVITLLFVLNLLNYIDRYTLAGN